MVNSDSSVHEFLPKHKSIINFWSILSFSIVRFLTKNFYLICFFFRHTFKIRIKISNFFVDFGSKILIAVCINKDLGDAILIFYLNSKIKFQRNFPENFKLICKNISKEFASKFQRRQFQKNYQEIFRLSKIPIKFSKLII